MWRQHKSLPQGEPNFRHLLLFPGLSGRLLLAYIVVHAVEDGGHVVTPKIIVLKNITIPTS